MSGSGNFHAANTNRIARLLLAVIFGVALLPFQAGASPAPEDIVVVGFKGDVRISKGGTPQSVQPGGTLSLPAAIRTGHDGSVDLRQGETTIGVGPDTQLDFPAPSQEGALFDRVVQPVGKAFYSIAPRGSSRLRVETPYLVAVIKGTQFNVAVDQDSSTISLFEGRLQVTAPDTDAVVELNAGEVAIRHSKEETIRVIGMKDRAAPAADTKGAGGTAAGTVTGTADKVPGLPRSPTPLDDDVDVVIDASKPGAAVDLADGTVSVDVAGDVGSSKAQVAVDAGADLGAVSVDAAVDTAVDLGGGTVDAAVDTAVDLGGGTVDAAVDAAVDLGGGAVDAAVDATVDLGGAGVDAAADTSIDLGAASIDTSLDAAADLGPVDAGLAVDAAVDASSATIDAGVDASLAGTDVGVDLGADLSGADAGLDLGLDVLGTEVDLGLGGDTAPAATDTGADSGGLLGGILHRLGQ